MPPCMAQTAPPCSSLNFPSLSSIDIGGAAVGVQEVKMVQLGVRPTSHKLTHLQRTEGRKKGRMLRKGGRMEGRNNSTAINI